MSILYKMIKTPLVTILFIVVAFSLTQQVFTLYYYGQESFKRWMYETPTSEIQYTLYDIDTQKLKQYETTLSEKSDKALAYYNIMAEYDQEEITPLLDVLAQERDTYNPDENIEVHTYPTTIALPYNEFYNNKFKIIEGRNFQPSDYKTPNDNTYKILVNETLRTYFPLNQIIPIKIYSNPQNFQTVSAETIGYTQKNHFSIGEISPINYFSEVNNYVYMAISEEFTHLIESNNKFDYAGIQFVFDAKDTLYDLQKDISQNDLVRNCSVNEEINRYNYIILELLSNQIIKLLFYILMFAMILFFYIKSILEINEKEIGILKLIGVSKNRIFFLTVGHIIFTILIGFCLKIFIVTQNPFPLQWEIVNVLETVTLGDVVVVGSVMLLSILGQMYLYFLPVIKKDAIKLINRREE